VRRPAPWRRRGILAAALLALPLRVAAVPRGLFEYLYVEANEGASSGGHVAVRFDNRCYHFQHVGAGRIRLVREPYAQFEHQYRIAGNRAIHAHRSHLDHADYEHLYAVFEAHYREEQRAFARLESLQADRELLASLARGHASSPRIVGSSYFFADGDSPETPAPVARSPAIDGLAERLRRRYGEDCIERRDSDHRAAIAALAPGGDQVEGAAGDSSEATFARRYRDHTAALLAVAVLRAGVHIRPATVAATDDEGTALSDHEVAALRRTHQQLSDDLVRLFASPRNDWGIPMLIGLARLAAVDTSIRQRRLLLIDVFREDAQIVLAHQARRHHARLRALVEDRDADYRDARGDFFTASAYDESLLSRLEVTAAIALELRTATQQFTDLRMHADGLLPAKSARHLAVPQPRLDAATLADALAVAQRREADYAAQVTRRYPYDLIENNCVTEILRLLHAAALSRPTAAVIDLDRLEFIPFLSPHALPSPYGNGAYRRLPSYRETALARMYAVENDALVYARESNVLTSTLYEQERDDSAFLFFTDDAFLQRPLLGLANLTTGLLTTLAGIATFPVDGGRTLRAGTRGALFSLPEVGFVSIRKGSFSFVPQRWLEPADRR